jgi:hypothetical protein
VILAQEVEDLLGLGSLARMRARRMPASGLPDNRRDPQARTQSTGLTEDEMRAAVLTDADTARREAEDDGGEPGPRTRVVRLRMEVVDTLDS